MTVPSLINLHVPLILVSYALLAAASGLGIAFLVQERWMKAHSASALALRFPPLERMDQLIHRMILAAFPLLSLGMVLGMFRAREVWGRYWDWNPKETFALITWAIYLAFLALRWARGWHGRKSTYLSLAGFALALITYALVFHVRFHA